jgi:type III restriction enzyme
VAIREGVLKAIEFIHHARPVVVLDEPQNLATELRTKAIESLNPLCTLRYSATHKDYFNLVYRLDLVKAYDLRLVKRIEVDSVVDAGDFNKPYIAVKSITATSAIEGVKQWLDLTPALASGENHPPSHKALFHSLDRQSPH